jgi:hypothetical protein
MIFARRGVLVLAGSVGNGISLRAIYFKGRGQRAEGRGAKTVECVERHLNLAEATADLVLLEAEEARKIAI